MRVCEKERLVESEEEQTEGMMLSNTNNIT